MRMSFAKLFKHSVCTKLLTGLVMVCVMILSVGIVAHAEEPYIRDGGTIMYVCVDEGSFLNGRAEPSRYSEATMRLYNGYEVEVVGSSGDWLEIVGGESGTSFVKAEYISEFKEPVEYVNVSGGRVFIRDGIEGKTTGKVVKAKKTVRVTIVMNNWGYIGSGWVNLKYFEPKE